MRHRQVHYPVGHLWWRRCACGLRRCPDVAAVRAVPDDVVRALRLTGSGGRPSWDGPTQAAPTVRPAPVRAPFMTLGMRWRGNGGRRRS
jgi:hypothetical protein